jgi:hypothetical protein
MGDKPDYVNGEPKPIPNNGPSMHDLVSLDLQDRKDYGLNKYDSLLQAFNGRNFLQDIYEEMQDGIVYLKGALEEQATVIRFVKFILERHIALYDRAFPDRQSEVVLITEGNIPGWLYAVNREVLGDRYEHRS